MGKGPAAAPRGGIRGMGWRRAPRFRPPPSWVTTRRVHHTSPALGTPPQSWHGHGEQPRLHAHGKPHEVLSLPFSRASSPSQQPAFTGGVNITDLSPRRTESPSPRTEVRRSPGQTPWEGDTAPVTLPKTAPRYLQHHSPTGKAISAPGQRKPPLKLPGTVPLFPLGAEPVVVWILRGLVEGDGTEPSLPATRRPLPRKLEDPRVSRDLPSLSFG